MSRLASRALAPATVCSLLLAAGCSNPDRHAPTPPDVEAIKQADAQYAQAWLANNPAHIMATLTEDAVIIPSGLPPIEGAAAIRAFWWPPESPPTTVHQFSIVQDEIGAAGDLAFVRGSFSLGFTYGEESYASGGEYLSVLRQDPTSVWRISHRMWSDQPN